MAKHTFVNMEDIKRIKPAKKSLEYFYDGAVVLSGNMGLRVSPKGKKVFFKLYYAGRSRKFTLGTFPHMSLADAKKELEKYAGRDPVKEKREKKTAEQQAKIDRLARPLISDLWKEYSTSARFLGRVDRSLYEDNRQYSKYIEPVLAEVAVRDVTPSMIAKMLKELADTAPVMSNRLYSMMRLMFKPALAAGWIDTHPMTWLDPPGGKEKARKRILSDEELQTLWPFMDNMDPQARDITRLCLLTCQRVGEIRAMKWSDIEDGIWQQSKNKTDTIFLCPLNKQALEILGSREKDSEWVFPYGRGHFKLIYRHRQQLIGLSGVRGWTHHDLRRTGRTQLSKLGIESSISERVLNHAQGGVAAVYDQHNYLKEKKEALRKLGNEIARIVGLELDLDNLLYMKQA